MNESEPLMRCRDVASTQSKATKYDTELKGVVATLSIVEVTYLLSIRLAVFRWHELYLGLFTELGNLNIDVRLRKATTYGFAGSTKGNAQ